MKHSRSKRVAKHLATSQDSIRTIMMERGKFLHGTRGKNTRGARGNKKF